MLEAGSQPTVQAGSQPTVGAASDEDICEWAFGGDDEGGACLFALEENKKDVRPRYLPYLYSLLYATAWPHQPVPSLMVVGIFFAPDRVTECCFIFRSRLREGTLSFFPKKMFML